MSLIDKYLGEQKMKKDPYGKKLDPNVEDYQAVKVGDYWLETYYDNTKYLDPWVGFIMGFGPVAWGNDRKEVLKAGKQYIKQIKPLDRKKWEKRMADYKKSGVIRYS